MTPQLLWTGRTSSGGVMAKTLTAARDSGMAESPCMSSASASGSPVPRLASLDQFRGYTVAAMFLVNFTGGYAATPAILRHHNTWCSFADTVMPQFFLAVGMALRLVMLREEARHGRAAAMRRGVKRGLVLMLLGFLWYLPAVDFKSWESLTAAPPGELFRNLFLTDVFQALTHIGLTSLWVLPVITGSARRRILFALASAGLHVWLSHAFWYETLHRWRTIDGGSLGFLTWTIPLIAGSLAYDVVQSAKPKQIAPILTWGAVLMAAGYGLACLTQGGVLAAPPFLRPWHPVDMWTMSQRAGSVTYLTFSAGFALAVYAFFVWWSDRRGHSLVLFTDLGRNALAAYLLHSMVMNLTERVGPKDSPFWWAALLSTAGFLLSWQATRWCNAKGLYLRL
jgi:predicted acyltransferase